MNDNKKPGWTERFSNWAPSDFSCQLMTLLSAYLSGFALGVTFTVILLAIVR